MPDPDLFGRPAEHELSDAEISALLGNAIRSAGRLSSGADLILVSIAAEYLVDHLRRADLVVVRRA